MIIQFSDIIPLILITDDESTDRVVKAKFIDALNGDEILSEAILSLKTGSSGYYFNNSFQMPNVKNIIVKYKVFEASGTNLLDIVEDVLSLPVNSGGGVGPGGGIVMIYSDELSAMIEDDMLISEITDQESIIVAIGECE